ncbi:MAG: hypothetical protein Harvfovirus17_14 [Harvfovirus sp.]|uniref:Uncharacterized protein n=1 Tax=Harvfovirus sp. TaxID=2487768 RepID=A0A3G5A1W6_9VIRU|nr:MAG: hypothetical protein Harvfovirus17_14 [Harvfovirus sp.]
MSEEAKIEWFPPFFPFYHGNPQFLFFPLPPPPPPPPPRLETKEILIKETKNVFIDKIFIAKLYEIAKRLEAPLAVGWCPLCYSMECFNPAHRCQFTNICTHLAKLTNAEQKYHCSHFHTAEEILMTIHLTKPITNRLLIKGAEPCMNPFEFDRKCHKKKCQFAHKLSQAVCWICLGNHFRRTCPFDTSRNTRMCKKSLQDELCYNQYCIAAHSPTEAICLICRENHFKTDCPHKIQKKPSE